MSEQSVEAVRYPALTARRSSSRRLPERLALRFPRPAAFLVRGVQRLPARSRLRQGLIRYVIRQGVEALNRGDFDAVFGFYDRDCEFTVPPSFRSLGLEGTNGRSARISFQRLWVAEWVEFRFEPEEIVDLGDGHRLLLSGRIKGSGLSSGAAFGSEWAALLTVSAGWVAREQVFFDHAEARQAAGLSV